jgi:hypothetical protein
MPQNFRMNTIVANQWSWNPAKYIDTLDEEVYDKLISAEVMLPIDGILVPAKSQVIKEIILDVP